LFGNRFPLAVDRDRFQPDGPNNTLWPRKPVPGKALENIRPRSFRAKVLQEKPEQSNRAKPVFQRHENHLRLFPRRLFPFSTSICLPRCRPTKLQNHFIVSHISISSSRKF